MSLHFSVSFLARGVACAVFRCLPLAALIMPTVGSAQTTLSLEQATDLAVQHAPTVEARRARLEAAQQEALRAGALPDPVLTVGIANLPVTGEDAFDTRADFMTMKRIGLRQEIPAGAKREARRTLAARTIDEADALAEVERLQVRRAAAEAWIDLWARQRELDALISLHEETELASRLARARMAGGSDPASDALAAEVAVLELGNRVEAARASHEAAQMALARWLGDSDAPLATAQAPDFTVLPVSESELLVALGRLALLLPANAEIETAAAAVDLARAEKRSDWSIVASYNQREGGRSDMLMFEIGIGLPLFPRNRQDRGVAAREADYQAALAEREDLHRQHIAHVRAGLALWRGLKRQVERDQSALLPLTRDRSATALAAYRAGAPVRPWLDARRDEVELLVDHAQRLGALGRAWAALAYLLVEEAPR